MKVVIAGGTGFLGRALIEAMTPVATRIVVLSRTSDQLPNATVVPWDGARLGDWVQELEGAEAVVNYAGSPVFCRWTQANREKILHSRLRPTQAIAKGIAACANPPKLWINGSATGYYGDRAEEVLEESSPAGGGFLADVCVSWEAATASCHTPVTLLRTGVVLSPIHPPLSIWLKLTGMFLGGAVADGKAYVPWIGLEDHARLVRFCIEKKLAGPVNAVAPGSVTNGELMRALRSRLRRPWTPPMPRAILQLAGRVGFPTETVLASTRAIPAVASSNDFHWGSPTLEDALL